MNSAEEPVAVKSVAYCRICGTPVLDVPVANVSAGQVYCELHQIAAGSSASGRSFSPGAGYSTENPYVAPPRKGPHPWAAFALGWIPGVGAVYNGQYAKGLLHALVTGLLISASREGGAPVGLVLGAWFFYMPFEAMRTAIKIRDGEPVDEFSGLFAFRGNRLSRIALPVGLVLLGVVMLLHNFDLIHIGQLVKFWPLGLIALGIYLAVARAHSNASSGPWGRP